MKIKQLLNWQLMVKLAFLPLAAALLFIVVVNVMGWFRYDERYFSPEYQGKYEASYVTSWALERALRTGDQALYAELTGLRRPPPAPTPNPSLILAIMLKADDAGYLHYMYFDSKTYKRSMQYLREVDGRWVVSPQDVYFLYHSGQWLKVFLPVTIVYWLILLVASLVIVVFRASARMRQAMTGI